MTEIFLKLLNMSITAGWIVLAVILFRLLFRKAPKWISCLLWSIVALRLLVPVSFQSPISLIPSPEVIPQDITVSEAPAIHSGIPAVNEALNPMLTLHVVPEENLLENVLSVAAVVWLTGVAVLLIYSIVTYLRLHRQVRASLPVRENVYICDDIRSAFVLGIFRPRIYLPSGMDAAQQQYVLAHENAHIKRRDHWWKPLGFLILSVYWFNPLLWLAYTFLCRDIEQACDEKVIGAMDIAGRKGYSEALIACSVHRRMIMACPLAFGEVGVKTRIKDVLRYKKPAVWIIAASVAVCAVAAMCFLTDPIPCEHVYHDQTAIASTCTHTGMQTHTCELCGYSYTSTVSMTAHTYDEGVVETQPSCTTCGSMTLTCTDCGAQRVQSMEKTAHVLGGPIAVTQPNCVETGQKVSTCIHCQEKFVTEVLQTNDDHDLRETVVKAATCNAPGEGILTCTRCDHTESCTYPQLEHQYTGRMIVEPTCMRFGVKEMTCTLCGDMYHVNTSIGNHNMISLGNGKEQCTHCGFTTKKGGGVSFDTSTPPKKPEDLFPVIRWDPNN